MLVEKEFFDETLVRTDLKEFGDKDTIYLFLVALDFTTINSYLDYEEGTRLGKIINDFLKNQNTYIKTIKLGSKFIYIFSEKVTSQMEKNLDDLTKKLWQENHNKELKQKIVFFVQKPLNVKNFSLREMNNKVFSLFDACLKIENQLNKTRGEVQRIIKSKQDFPSSIQKEFTIQNIIQNIPQDNMNDFRQNIRQKYNLAKSSYLLRESFNRMNKILDINNPNRIAELKIESLNLMFNYILWIKVQEMLLEIYKIEKIKAFFNPVSEDKIKFKDMENLVTWYNTVVESNRPYLSNNNAILANEIRVMIEGIKNKKDTDKIDLLIHKIRKFSAGFNPRGVFNVPLLRVQPNDETKTFFSRQYSYKFKEQGKAKYNQLRGMFKAKFPFVTDELNNFYTLFNEFNQEIIKKNEVVDFVMVFMELDGFNAFNKYMFGDDADKYYSIILNTFFEILNKMFYGNDFARNCVANIMGDEFFFASVMKPTFRLFTNPIRDFIKEVTKRIEQLTKNTPFVKSKKIKVKIKNMSKNSIDIVFREPMYNGNEWIIARIGVSTGVILKELDHITYSDFKEAYDECNKQVSEIKAIKYDEYEKERELVNNH